MTARDVQYGVSRLYAQELRFPGPDHVRALLAVPGSYPGPYAATPAQQAAFERAVEMSPDGMTLTFHLRRPAPDFDQVAGCPRSVPCLPAVTLETATTPGPSPQALPNLPRQRSSARTRSEPCVVARDRRPTPGGGGSPRRRIRRHSLASAPMTPCSARAGLLAPRWSSTVGQPPGAAPGQGLNLHFSPAAPAQCRCRRRPG